ncbi:MAG: hypothetical protein GXX96_08545 [Planctomycetaceae bacterium]|nr:hypothetical protein [Planctomycetaceae bacterium]
MSVSLNPITQQKLDEFERRRRRLVLIRGVCAGLVSFLLLMTLIAAADWLWVLPGSARWTMSLAGYAGTGLVVWLTCLRLLVHLPSRRELARFVETTEPRLREQLLSAIELCVDDPGSLHDSPVFRQLLQDRVGRQMESVEVTSLLPWKLVARWLTASLAIVAVFFLLLALPGFPFRQLMARAVLPGANLDRVSRVQVTILQPVPHSLTMPRDETVAIVVEISGGNIDEATLETRTPSGEAVRQPMRVHGPMQFAANVAVEEETIDYRILAGDAVTRRYTIRSRMRPHVVAYHKTYRPPEYARLPETAITESHGDLIALEGSEAEVVFELDQPVSQAELRLQRSGSDDLDVVALTQAEPLRYRAELPITDPGIYTVHLVAEETGFDNPFSPKSEIRPEPDLIPRAGFVGIDDTTLLLPPNDILSLAGLAEDDLPLAGLEQQFSVNGRDWQSVPLSIAEDAHVTVDWQWDMLDLNLKSGDQVTTKLVATDRKGNVGESIPLQIVISSPDFDPDRHAVMQRKSEVYDRLAAMAEAVGQHCDAAQSVLARLQEDTALSEIPETDRLALLDLAHKVREEAEPVAGRITELLPAMPAGVDAEELELASRLLARIQSDHMRVPATYLDLPRDPQEPAVIGDDLKKIAAAFQQAADDVRELHQRFRLFLTHDILAAAAADLDAVGQYQSQLLQSPAQLSWQRLLRQETVVATQLHAVEQLIRANSPRLYPRLQERILEHLNWISERRIRLEERMESEDQLPALREAAQRLADELPGRQQIATPDSSLPRNLVDARRELDKRSGSLHEPIKHLAEVAATVQSSTARLAKTEDSRGSRQLQVSIERAAGLSKRLQGDGFERLSNRRAVTQARSDADTQYASDAGLTRRALAGVLNRATPEPVEESEIPEIFCRVASAYRVLEAGHGAVQLDKALADLLSRERWQSQQVCARLDHPRRWDAFQNGCEQVADALKTAGYPAEIVGMISHLRSSPSANEAGARISVRRRRRDQLVSAAHELAEMKVDLDATLKEIEPIMAEARAVLARYVPTLPQMARQAAEEVRQLEEQTEATADSLAVAEPQAASQQMDRVEQRQDEINRQLDDLLDALAEDADQQDLLTDEGRERARDADDSTQMLQEPAAQMNRAMDQAAAAPQPDEQARDLSRAADQQERTADVLDKIAEHYERLESGADVAETRQALRQAERDMGIARQMDQQYDDARQLAEMAAKSPEDLMAELEAELARNPVMQDALSEISRDALAQARNSLQHSAEREADMERSVEQSDQDFQEKKRVLAEELSEIGRAASSLASRQVNQAESFASRGKDEQARNLLRTAREQLDREVARARDTDPRAALDDLLETARRTAEQAQQAAQLLRQGEQSTAKTKDENIPGDEQRRAEYQRSFEDDQKQFHEQVLRDARGRARELAQNQQRTEEQVKARQRDLQKTQQDVDRKQESLNRDPQSQSAQRSLQEAEARRNQLQRELDRAQRTSERAKQRRDEADKVVEQLEKKELQPLSAPNPAAELANRYAGESAEQVEQMANRARQLAQRPDWAYRLTPPSNELNESRQRQAEIGVDVEQAGEDVARAARHEARLDKPELAERLAERAQDIGDVAEGEVAQSEQELDEAAREAEPENGPQQGNRQAMEAHASIGEAERAISRQAEALDAALSPPEAASQTAAADQPAGESQASQTGSTAPPATPEQAARAQMLARTLDELDQALADSQASPGSPATPQPAPSTLAGAAQAQATRMAQARMQARMAAQMPGREGGEESQQGAALVGQGGSDAALQPVARAGDDWGKLRDKSAEDTVARGADAFSAEYRKQVETYFRVIAERARTKK